MFHPMAQRVRGVPPTTLERLRMMMLILSWGRMTMPPLPWPWRFELLNESILVPSVETRWNSDRNFDSVVMFDNVVQFPHDYDHSVVMIRDVVD